MFFGRETHITSDKCVSLPRNSFNPSLFRFVAISAVLCHCFKAMLLVRILAEQCLTHASYCWAVLSCGTVHLIIMLYKVVLTTGSMNEILKCYHSDESYWAVLSCHGNVYYAVQGGSSFFETVKNSCSVPIQMKTSLPILSDGTVNYALQSGSYFWVFHQNPVVSHFKWSFLSSMFTWNCLFFSILESVLNNYCCWIFASAT